jgi:hypothetical protein
MMVDTILVLSGIGVPLYSARGLTQSLEPIDAAANLQRTINGELVDFSYAQFRKYKSSISCSDQRPPACDGIWPGKVVTVDCVSELSYLTATGSPQREVVTDSSYVEGDFTFYRPRLNMLVVGFSMTADEWDAGVNWQLQLEEI